MLGKDLRNYFLAGLFAVLPLSVTIYILYVGFRWADGILGAVVEKILGRSVPGLGLFLILLLILFAGLITTNFIGRRLVASIERLLLRVPVVGSIYGTTKQITEAISSSDKAVFRSVVLVEYPRKGVYTLGFKTGDPPAGIPGDGQWVTVFIPTVPNPATGFVFLFPEREVVTLPVSIEDGLKYFISAGVVRPVKKPEQPESSSGGE